MSISLHQQICGYEVTPPKHLGVKLANHIIVRATFIFYPHKFMSSEQTFFLKILYICKDINHMCLYIAHIYLRKTKTSELFKDISVFKLVLSLQCYLEPVAQFRSR